MLSAFVYPGAGQFVQKRWLAGGLFAILFTLFFILLTVAVIIPLFAYLNHTLDWAATQGMSSDIESEGVSLRKVALYFLVNLAVYVVNLADVISANRKMAKPPPLPL